MRKRARWREMLDSIIQVRSDRDRIAAEMGITPVTLTRWASGESTPRTQSLRSLLNALPIPYREQFQALIEEDHLAPSLEVPSQDPSDSQIPFQFINTVLMTRATSSAAHIFWVITHQVLQHALLQLDSRHLGMKITLLRCMPPTSDGKIHSLREAEGLGTPPWSKSFEEHPLFAGAETLAGHTVVTSRYQQIPDMRENSSFLPYHQAEYEVSAATCPITLCGRIAGCLVFSSTQPHSFNSEEQRVLVQGYTNLIALAFEEKDFYPQDLIELLVVPPPEAQREHLTGFQQRVSHLMREAMRQSQPLTRTQAERRAWQEIEAVLLHLPYHLSESE